MKTPHHPRPLALESTHGPDYPADAFPSWMGPFVHSVAASLQVPLAMAAPIALGALSAAAAGKARVRVEADWVEPLNLFLGLTAPPGGKKSPVLKQFVEPLAEFERELILQTAPAVRAARLKRERLEAEAKKAKQGDDWQRAEELEAEIESLPPTAAPRLFTSDVTAQKLAELLATHGRMAILAAEPTVFATMSGRWSSGNGPELEIFLAGHAGDSFRVDRLGRPPDIVPSACLTVCVALQPEALKRLARPEILERGLPARFIWAVPQDVRGTSRFDNAVPIPEGHKAEFARGMRALLELPAEEACVLELSSGARDVFKEFHDRIEVRLLPMGDLRNLHGWAEKLRGTVARVAGLFHLADYGAQGKIRPETMLSAVAVGDWAIAHAKIAFDIMDVAPDRRAARAIVGAIRRAGKGRITAHALHQDLKDAVPFKYRVSLDPGLGLLVRQGWLTPVAAPSKPGRPSEAYDVHPDLLSFEGFEGQSRGAA